MYYLENSWFSNTNKMKRNITRDENKSQENKTKKIKKESENNKNDLLEFYKKKYNFIPEEMVYAIIFWNYDPEETFVILEFIKKVFFDYNENKKNIIKKNPMHPYLKMISSLIPDKNNVEELLIFNKIINNLCVKCLIQNVNKSEKQKSEIIKDENFCNLNYDRIKKYYISNENSSIYKIIFKNKENLKNIII